MARDDLVEEILCCPDCRGTVSRPAENEVLCSQCGRAFAVTQGIYRMMPSNPLEDRRGEDNPHYQKWLKVASQALSEYFENANPLFHAIHHSAHRRVARNHVCGGKTGWTLDLGCGTGAHYQYHQGLDRVVGLDPNIDSLQRIRSRYAGALLVQGDARRLPFRANAFASVISIYSLEHIFHLNVALDEVVRALADDGLFHLGIPCEGGLAWRLGRRLTSQRSLSRRYGIDYAQVIRIEHCNTARKILESMNARFHVLSKEFFPIQRLRSVDLNLTLTLVARKAPAAAGK